MKFVTRRIRSQSFENGKRFFLREMLRVFQMRAFIGRFVNRNRRNQQRREYSVHEQAHNKKFGELHFRI
jgi:hypothetical protein